MIEGFALVSHRVVHPDAARLLCLGLGIAEGHERRIVAGRVAGGVVDPANIIKRDAVGLVLPPEPQLQPPGLAGDVDAVTDVALARHEQLAAVVEKLADKIGAKVFTTVAAGQPHVGRGDVAARRGPALRRPRGGDPALAEASGRPVFRHRPDPRDQRVGKILKHLDSERKGLKIDRLTSRPGGQQPARNGRHRLGLSLPAGRRHGQFHLVGAASHRRGLPLDQVHPLLDLPITKGKLAEHQQADGNVDQHIASTNPENHHQAGQEHQRGDARLNQLPHDPQARLVHSPRLTAEEHARRPHAAGHGRRHQRQPHQLPLARPGRRGQGHGREHRARLHQPPDGVVGNRWLALQAVGLMAGEDHEQGQQSANQ